MRTLRRRKVCFIGFAAKDVFFGSNALTLISAGSKSGVMRRNLVGAATPNNPKLLDQFALLDEQSITVSFFTIRMSCPLPLHMGTPLEVESTR
jgi:hypothetical protein